MKIDEFTPSGVAEDPRGADPHNPDPFDAPTQLTREGSLLGLSVARSGPGISVVRVAGELDMLTAPLLDSCLGKQLAAGPAHLVVDLEAVSFMGSTGLNTLITARELAQTTGSVLHLAGMKTRAVVRPLEVTGLLPLFNLYPTLAAALSELTGAESDDPGSTGRPLPAVADTG